MIAALQKEFLDELRSSGEFLLLVSFSRFTAIRRSKGRLTHRGPFQPLLFCDSVAQR